MHSVQEEREKKRQRKREERKRDERYRNWFLSILHIYILAYQIDCIMYKQRTNEF